jgi:integrase
MRSKGTKTSKGYWRIRVSVTDEFGRKKQKGFERKTLAAADNAAKVWEAAHGRFIPSTPQTGTLSDLFDYVEIAVWARTGERNLISMKSNAEKWKSAIGDVPVENLTAPVLTRVLDAMNLKSKSAIDKAVRAIRQAMDYAVSDLGWIAKNVADDLRKPKHEPEPKFIYEPITLAEYNRMVGLAGPRVQLLLRLTGECGLRPIDAMRARPEHLFTVRDRWMLNVPKSKTEAGKRNVPISDSLTKLLQSRTDTDWSGIKDPNEHIRKWWRENSKTRLYDLRGWCIDNWRRIGIPEQMRTYLAGHTNPKFTQTVYETLESPEILDAFFPSDTVVGQIVGKNLAEGENE